MPALFNPGSRDNILCFAPSHRDVQRDLSLLSGCASFNKMAKIVKIALK